MCGIVGAFSLDGRPVDEDVVARMRDAMAHREPDSLSLWVSNDRRVAFGHRRLKVLDLSAAADQPMLGTATPAGDALAIVFNKKIYDHAEIRRELAALAPHRFATNHSDTETILHAYEA